jgi:hypothetical protein
MAYEDLLKDTSESKDDGNYFLVTITDLDLGTAYPLQFRWKNKNGTLGAWSSVKTFVSESATIPSEPNLGSGDVVGGAGFIKVTWDGNNALSTAASNFDRVNVHISGTTFGDGTKPAGFFKQAGTQTFAAVAGEYIVQLKILTVNGSESLYSTARTVTVTSAVQSAASSVTPSTPTVSSVLGAIQLSWNGKTSTGADQPFGFNAAKVYVGTSAGFTPSSSNQVDVLNFANGQNTLNIGVGTIVDSVALTYGVDYYIKIATTNGTDTSTAVSATGNPVRVGQVTTGDIVTINADKIATGTLSSGSTITVGSTSGKHIKLSGTGDPFIIYGSGGTSNPVLSYNGAKLTIVGDGTFSGALSAATGTFTGTLSAATGSFDGTITASGGTIGGITIAADGIQNSGGTFKIDSSGVIRAGSSSSNAVIISPTLGIYHSANGGSTASGRFTLGLASSTISGWTIGTSTLSSGNLTLNSNGTITTTNLTIYDTGRIVNAGGFEVTAAGKLIATGAEISGTITASALDTTALDIAATGAITTTSGNFGVTSSGILSASSVTINGTLTANNGSVIGAWSVDSFGTLSAGSGLSATYLFSPTTTDPNGSLFSIYTNKEIYASTGFSTAAGSGAITFLSTSATLSPIGNLRVNGAFAPSFDDTYSLGFTSARWSIVRSAGGVSTTSDQRKKTNIVDSDLGLDFINSLRPVKYKMISGGNEPVLDDSGNKLIDEYGNYVFSSRPGIRDHYGLIAQEVKSAIDLSGVEDFGGWQLDDKNDLSSDQGLVYHQFISPIIKAIQEISTRLDALEG